MLTTIKKVWNDPVGSKVIGGIILGVLGCAFGWLLGLFSANESRVAPPPSPSSAPPVSPQVTAPIQIINKVEPKIEINNKLESGSNSTQATNSTSIAKRRPLVPDAERAVSREPGDSRPAATPPTMSKSPQDSSVPQSIESSPGNSSLQGWPSPAD